MEYGLARPEPGIIDTAILALLKAGDFSEAKVVKFIVCKTRRRLSY